MPARLPLLSLMALYLAGLGAAGQFAKLSVPFDTLAAAYPQASANLGLVVTVISALGVVCGLFAGLLVARLGYRRMLLFALWLGALMSALQVAMPPLPVMFALRFFEGVSHLAVVVAAPTLMAQLSPDRFRPAVMSVWSTFFGMAFALTAWGGLPLVNALGLPSLLAFHAALMAFTAAVLSLSLTRLPAQDRRSDRLSLGVILRDHIRVYRSPHLSAPALGWLCYTLTYVALLTVLPQELAPEDRAWASALMPLAGLVVSLSLGILALRFVSAVSLVMFGFALGIAGAVAMAFQPDSAVLAVGIMAALGFVQSGSFAAIPQLNAAAVDQAEANGAMAQMGNLGNFLGTPMLLWALGVMGSSGIFVALIMAYVVGVIIHAVQALRRR